MLRKLGQVVELSGQESGTTNNRMEVTAAIKALETLPEGSDVVLFTDSRYLQRGIMFWVRGWQANQWRTREGDVVKNQDLWQILSALNDRHVISWNWVKGHAGDKWNDRCDVLATEATKVA